MSDKKLVLTRIFQIILTKIFRIQEKGYKMELFSKKFTELNEDDLKKLVADPKNFEDYQIEYKIDYDSEADELRRDIIQFSNSFNTGYLIFGMDDNPVRIIGIEREQVDTLKVVLNNVLPKKFSPLHNPLPEYNPIPLSDGKFVFITKIKPKLYGAYGIRKSDNMSKPRDYKTFEFYKRLDGSKHQMDIDELVELIEKKAKLRNLPEISTQVGLKDERIELIVLAIKNLTIRYYKEGVINKKFDSSVSELILDYISMVDRLKPHFRDKFAPNGGVSHTTIISTYFNHLGIENFKEKVLNREIIPENINRTIFIHAGDIAFEIYDIYKTGLKHINILLDDLRKEYQHLIQANKIISFRENYRENIFNESLSILEDYGIIRTTGKYTGSDCKDTYEIRDLNRLQQFIEKYSLAYLQ